MRLLAKNINKRLALLFILISLCYSCKTSEAIQEEKVSTSILDKILEDGVLRVGTTGDYKPFTFRLKGSSELQGMDIIMANDLASTLGVSVEFVPTSWPTLIDDFRQNKFDIGMSGIAIKLDRQRVGFFSIPIFEGGKSPICRDEDAKRFKYLDSINQKKVRVIFNPGGTNEEFARSNFPKATLIENADNISIFQRIVDNEADVMVTDQMEAQIQQVIHPELEAVNTDKPLGFFEMAYLLPRDAVWKAYVDQWLHLRKKQGKVDSILMQEAGKLMKSGS